MRSPFRALLVVIVVLLVGSLPACGDEEVVGDRGVLPAIVDDPTEAVDEIHVAYAPEVPPPAERTVQRRWSVHLEILEGVCPLDPANDVTTLMWGYRVAGDDEVSCGAPGPVLRGRVGDLAEITLTNPASNEHPHNIDFHAVTGQGGGAAALTVAPGESATIEVRLLYPGAFMYHCAFGDVPEHIARGVRHVHRRSVTRAPRGRPRVGGDAVRVVRR